MITKLTGQQEIKLPNGPDIVRKWEVSESPSKYIDKLLEGVVGLKINIKHTQGKFNLQQDMSNLNVKGI